MKRAESEEFKREFKKINYNLIVGIVCIILGGICFALAYYDSHKIPKDTQYFNEIIESEEDNRIEKESNLKIAKTPIRFAKLKNSSTKKLYITTDNEFYYIIALTDSKYNEIIKQDLETNPVTIYGTTKEISSDIKNLALSFYNSSVGEEYRIEDEDFYGTFGDLYLDATKESNLSLVLYIIGGFASLFSTCFLIVFAIMKIKVEKTLKKIEDSELQKIEAEIEEKEAFHYDKARLILTRNYIISFIGGLQILKYEDIIWIYEYRLRQYGITTQKSIMVMNKNGKVKPIVTLDGVTKKSKLVFDEISETIINKNDKILVGYNKENRKKIKEDYNF